MAMEDTAATEVKAEAEASAEHSQQALLSFSDDEIVRAATPVREQDLHSVPSNKHCSFVAARAHGRTARKCAQLGAKWIASAVSAVA